MEPSLSAAEKRQGRLIEITQKLADAATGEWTPEQQAECARLHREIGDMLASPIA